MPSNRNGEVTEHKHAGHGKLGSNDCTAHAYRSTRPTKPQVGGKAVLVGNQAKSPRGSSKGTVHAVKKLKSKTKKEEDSTSQENERKKNIK